MYRRLVLLISLLSFWGVRLCAQLPINPERYPKLISRLDTKDPAEQTMSCEVKTFQPDMSFDFRLLGGYSIALPLKHYFGKRQRFSILTRITPRDTAAPPVYLRQVASVPEIPRNNKIELQLNGAYFVGEGKYSIDLLTQDQMGRACRKRWQIEARRSRSSQALPALMAPGSIAPFTFATWKSIFKSPENDASHPLRLSVLLHVAPLFRRSTNLRIADQEMLLGSLASLIQELPPSHVQLVAFNLDQQSEVFRQDEFNSSGWDRLLEAIERLELGKVSYGVLTRRNGHADLLAKLVGEQLAGSTRPDAVIFLGPTARQNDKAVGVPSKNAASGFPRFFYFEYKPYLYRGGDFPDVIYHVTHAFDGKVFRIHSPSEFASALKSVRASLEEKSGQAGE